MKEKENNIYYGVCGPHYIIVKPVNFFLRFKSASVLTSLSRNLLLNSISPTLKPPQTFSSIPCRVELSRTRERKEWITVTILELLKKFLGILRVEELELSKPLLQVFVVFFFVLFFFYFFFLLLFADFPQVWWWFWLLVFPFAFLWIS